MNVVLPQRRCRTEYEASGRFAMIHHVRLRTWGCDVFLHAPPKILLVISQRRVGDWQEMNTNTTKASPRSGTARSAVVLCVGDAGLACGTTTPVGN